MRTLVFLSAILILLTGNSCEKFRKDPVLKTSFAEITADGVSIGASVENSKKVTVSGFCYGKTSNPQSNSDYDVLVSINSNGMETVIPYIYFESYTGYYIRPFAKTEHGIFYGDEVYFPAVQSPPVTPPCNPSDNYISIGAGTQVETFYNFDMPEENSYFNTVRAHSNAHHFTFEFNTKLKTGIYTTDSGSDDLNKVKVYFYTGFISGAVLPGNSVYVNEVSKGKFEISLCNAPWNQGSGSTFYLTTKVVTP